MLDISFGGDPDITTALKEVPDKGNAPGGMTQSPVQWCDQNAEPPWFLFFHKYLVYPEK
jgi:hypothetical protein